MRNAGRGNGQPFRSILAAIDQFRFPCDFPLGVVHIFPFIACAINPAAGILAVGLGHAVRVAESTVVDVEDQRLVAAAILSDRRNAVFELAASHFQLTSVQLDCLIFKFGEGAPDDAIPFFSYGLATLRAAGAYGVFIDVGEFHILYSAIDAAEPHALCTADDASIFQNCIVLQNEKRFPIFALRVPVATTVGLALHIEHRVVDDDRLLNEDSVPFPLGQGWLGLLLSSLSLRAEAATQRDKSQEGDEEVLVTRHASVYTPLFPNEAVIPILEVLVVVRDTMRVFVVGAFKECGGFFVADDSPCREDFRWLSSTG